MAKVTVALSVYNVAEFVRASLDCVVNQTMRDIEILCIDDASADGTWDILQEYAARDSRVRLWRMEHNGGLSVSRNKAMELATGEYIIMLDGDDLFALDMVEKAYNKAVETGADMVLWDYCAFYNEKELPTKVRQPSSLKDLDGNDKVKLLRRPAFTPTRMIKMKVVRKLRIHFPERLTKQDIPIHWQLVTSLEKIALIPERFLRYRQQPNSTTNRRGRSLFSLATVMDITGEYLRESGLYETYRDEFWRSRLSLLHGMYDFVLPSLRQEALLMIVERVDEDASEYIASARCELTSRTRNFYGMLAGSRWSKMKYNAVVGVRSLYRNVKKLLRL